MGAQGVKVLDVGSDTGKVIDAENFSCDAVIFQTHRTTNSYG